MALWLARAGRQGEDEELALENGICAIGWADLGDLVSVKRKEEIDALYEKTYPGASAGRRTNHVGQLWAFSHKIRPDDLVVLPRKRTSTVAIGRVTGPYKYKAEFPRCPHTIPVTWLQTDLARTKFEQDLLYSFGAFMTVCQIVRNDAEARVRAMLEGSAYPAGQNTDADPEATVGQQDLDVELAARDQLSTFLLRKFKGHDMARLVEAVLNVEGYMTQRAEPGADGGVDILAGSGPLGLSPPKLCVQVKSQESAADVTVFRALQGSMQTFQADQGLLVCWGGFRRAVVNEARLSFFKVRLWDAGNLVDAVLKSYDRFPDELQAELPLKRIWALVPEE